MPLYQLGEWKPEVGESIFIADSADIVGRVKIGNHANIWFGVVARGDVDTISIGENTNIQDQSLLHVSSGFPLSIGKNVTLGHKVTAHGCTIGDHCLIGMGSIILDGVEIGENSLVAAGSLIPPGKKFPPRSFIMGSPAKFIRELTREEVEKYGNHYKAYLHEKDEYLRNLKTLT
jgi:gamma-carbonic anhydrase